MNTDVNKLASAWVELMQRNPGSEVPEDKLWAHEELVDLSLESPIGSWRLVMRILELTDHDMALASLGAGPIEDMLVAFPDFTIEKVEAEFPRNVRLQQAVDSVWKSDIPDEIWQRLQFLRGTIEPTWE